MQTFGQLDRRAERNQATQRWLNCAQVVAPGVTLPPPPRLDVEGTVRLIRENLLTSPSLRLDVSGDDEAIPLVRARLTPDENARVQFNSLTPKL